jgi:dTDP-4-amino-4,6-dideoxy-D-glucose transaminase
MINVTKVELPELVEYIGYLEKIWDSGWITNDGELLSLLESNLKDFLDVNNMLLVSNGTLAIQLALKSLDIKGDVITTPFTFPATTNAILWEGLNPVFADIDPETFNIDVGDVESKITKNTSAILAVHIYGNPCDVKDLQKIAQEHDLKLIYDAAHAFGVEFDHKSILEYGDISTISFHATKVFSTIEGGALVVHDDEIVEKVKLLRNHGIKSEEIVVLAGINAKMNEFQAAMGLCNLDGIVDSINRRKRIYELYKENLENTDIKFQKLTSSKYNYGYMPVCFDGKETRDNVYNKLLKSGIHCRKYFYPLVPNYEYFKREKVDLVKKYNLKCASDVSDGILCLPLYPELKTDIVKHISDNIISELY